MRHTYIEVDFDEEHDANINVWFDRKRGDPHFDGIIEEGSLTGYLEIMDKEDDHDSWSVCEASDSGWVLLLAFCEEVDENEAPYGYRVTL